MDIQQHNAQGEKKHRRSWKEIEREGRKKESVIGSSPKMIWSIEITYLLKLMIRSPLPTKPPCKEMEVRSAVKVLNVLLLFATKTYKTGLPNRKVPG